MAATERFLPDPDLTVTELALVEADPARTYAAIDDADVSVDRLLGVLGGLTDLDKRLAGSTVRPKKLGKLLGSELGFVPLADEPGSLRAVGLAARYSRSTEASSTSSPVRSGRSTSRDTSRRRSASRSIRRATGIRS